MRTCKRCLASKPEEEFYNRRCKSYCKICTLELNRLWKLRNKDRVNAQARKWHVDNHEKSKMNNKKWSMTNKEKKLSTTRKSNRKRVEQLSDAYMKTVFCVYGAAAKSDLEFSKIPRELIEAKKLQLRILRELRSAK